MAWMYVENCIFPYFIDISIVSVGWNMTLEYAVSASAVAQGWAGYVMHLLDQLRITPPIWLHGLELVSYIKFRYFSFMGPHLIPPCAQNDVRLMFS